MQDQPVLVGFDGAADGDLVVFVLRRDSGGPWQLDRVDGPPQLDVAALVAQLALTYRPPTPGPSMAELVEQWMAEVAGEPPLELDDHQRQVLTAAYADTCTPGGRAFRTAVRQARVTTPMLTAHVPPARHG